MVLQLRNNGLQSVSSTILISWLSELQFIILDIWVNRQHVHFHICAQTYILLLETIKFSYNHRSLWLSSSCESLRSNVKNAQVCTYTHSFAHIHSLTFIGATSRFMWAQSFTWYRYIIIGAIRPILHQCDITSTAPECPMLLCFNNMHLFLAIIVVLLFFIQIVYNLDTEAVIRQRNLFMWKWLLSWYFMTLN